MTVLLQVFLLILEMVHCSQGQTMLDCSLRPFCEERNLRTGLLAAVSNDEGDSFVRFVCNLNTVSLAEVRITWYRDRFDNESGADPANVQAIFTNFPPNDLYSTTVAITNLGNFSFGDVEGTLTIRNFDVSGMHEGVYSCAESRGDISSRRYSGCLFVLGRGEFESCPDNLTAGCNNITQSVTFGEKVAFDVKVAFCDGGDCANEAVAQLTLTKDSEVVYVCSNTMGSGGQCNSDSNSRFMVVNGADCIADCKYYIDLVLLDFNALDVGAYTAKVLFQGLGDAEARSINRTFVLEAKIDNVAGSITISMSVGQVTVAVLLTVVMGFL